MSREMLRSRTPVPRRLFYVAVVWVALGGAGGARGERLPEEGPNDPRIRTVVYSPRDVVRIDGTYGYHTVVELGVGEVIESMVIGDSVAWEAERNAAGNRIFLKPKESNAATNLTVITDRRTYSFALRASRSTAKEKMTWRLRFQYPEEEARERLVIAERAELARTSLVNADAPQGGPADWNFDYSFAGAKRFAPIQTFDDGRFTYLRFKERTALPAIFEVGADKSESLVNARVSGEYVVVHRVVKQLALRSGNTLTCIFNDAFEGDAGPGNRVNAPRAADRGGVFRGRVASER